MWISKKDYRHIKRLEKAQDNLIEVDNRLIEAQKELIASLFKVIDHLEKNNETIQTSNQ